MHQIKYDTMRNSDNLVAWYLPWNPPKRIETYKIILPNDASYKMIVFKPLKTGSSSLINKNNSGTSQEYSVAVSLL